MIQATGDAAFPRRVPLGQDSGAGGEKRLDSGCILK